MGHICTARHSATLGKTVAMALVKAPLNTPGTELFVFQDEGQGESRFTARVIPMPFYDPKGLKLRGNLREKGEN